jgi:cytoskeleton protein RodZ
MVTNTSHKEHSGHWQADSNNPGELLKKARVSQGLDIDELARQLGLTPSRIVALEDNQYDQLPSAVYVRGYIKRYCSVLGLSADPVLAGYESLIGSTRADDAAVSATPAAEGDIRREGDTARRQSRKSKGLKIPKAGPRQQRLFLIAAIVLALLLMWVIQPSDGREVSLPTSAKANLLTPEELVAIGADALLPQSDKSTEANVGALQTVYLQLSKESWVEVLDANQDVLLADLVPAGQLQVLNGVAPFDVSLAQAQGAQLVFEGQLVNPPLKQDGSARWAVGQGEKPMPKGLNSTTR